MSASASTAKKTSSRTVTPKFPYLTALITSKNDAPIFLFAPATDLIKKYIVSSTGETGSHGDATPTPMLYDLLKKMCGNDIKIYISDKTTGINSTYIKTTYNNKFNLKYEVIVVGPTVNEEKFEELMKSDEKCEIKDFKWQDIFSYASNIKEFYSTFADPVVIDYKFNEQRNTDALKQKDGYEDSIEKGKTGLTRIFRTFSKEEYEKKVQAIESALNKSQCKGLFTVKCEHAKQPVKKSEEDKNIIECIKVIKTYEFNNIKLEVGACMKDLFANAFDKFNAKVIAENKQPKDKKAKKEEPKKEEPKKEDVAADKKVKSPEKKAKVQSPEKKGKKASAEYENDTKQITDDEEELPNDDDNDVITKVKATK